MAKILAGEPRSQQVDRRKGMEAADVPFELTRSCMTPPAAAGPQGAAVHCGECSKCRERHDAFREADVRDSTVYATKTHLR